MFIYANTHITCSKHTETLKYSDTKTQYNKENKRKHYILFDYLIFLFKYYKVKLYESIKKERKKKQTNDTSHKYCLWKYCILCVYTYLTKNND